MPLPLRLLFTLALIATSARSQVVVLDNFNNPGASGSILTSPSTSWINQVTRNPDSITVGGTARNDNGWGVIGGLNINAATMTHITVVARLDTGNQAPFLVVSLEDFNLRTHTVSISTSAFALGTLTTVNIPLGSWVDFDPSRITGWNIGGGAPPTGTSLFRMTFDHLSLTGGQPPQAPTVTTEPADRAVGVGASAAFTVAANANNSGPLRYQWSKDGAPLSGQTQSTLPLASLTVAQSGLYRVAVTNDAGTTQSREARLTVFDARPTHALPAGTVGYNPNGTVPLPIEVTLTFTGTSSALRWAVFLPTGWTYHADNSTTAATRPTANSAGIIGPHPLDGSSSGMIEWTWTSVPPSPLTFIFTLNVPIGTGGDRHLTALATFTQNGVTGDILVKPDRLVIRNAFERHSADLNNDRRLGLAELTRVIELFNTRNGTNRTGAYDEDPSLSTEDGFISVPTRAVGATITVLRRHSADWQTSFTLREPDGRIDLEELLRVIQLYNVREGTVRTGAYRVTTPTDQNPDGFVPGP